MAKILNPSLPAGTVGLWWFAQDLANLGTAATGSAVLTGASLTGGKVVMDATTDSVTLSADARLLVPVPTSALTIMAGYQWADTTSRQAGGFGTNSAPVAGQFLGSLFPWDNSNVYWDAGGSTEGTTRLRVAITKDTTERVWGWTIGARGMEVWRSGVTIWSNSGTPSVSLNNEPFYLGKYVAIASDLGSWAWFFVHTTQLSTTLIGNISSDPEGTLTADSAGAAAAGTRLNRGLNAPPIHAGLN